MHEILRGVLVLKQSGAFEGPASTPVLPNQSRASSMLPWKSPAIRIQKALLREHVVLSCQARHLPHEALGRSRRQMFRLVPRHYPILEPSAAAARHEYSMIALVVLAYHPGSSDPI